MHLKRISLLLGLAVALALGFAPGTARADFIINTDGTSTAGGGADVTSTGGGGTTVNAQVRISFASDGTMTVTLSNLLSTTTQGGQELTGITINTSPAMTVNSPLISTSGQLTDGTNKFVETGATGLNNQNQFVGGSSSSGTGISTFDGGSGTGHNAVAASNWNVTQSTPGQISVFGGGKPTESVLSASGNGNVQQSPFFSQTVTLVAGTNENTLTNFSITSVTFQFGTQPGQDIVTVRPHVATPAPSSAVLLGIGGLSLVGFVGLRRRRLATAAA